MNETETTYIETHKTWIDPMVAFELAELENCVAEVEVSLVTGEVFEIFNIH